MEKIGMLADFSGGQVSTDIVARLKAQNAAKAATDAQTDAAAAAGEVQAVAGEVQAVAGDVAALSGKIGDLETLNTTEKETIVGAVNEVLAATQPAG